MGKRYGRNQKRAHREEIARLADNAVRLDRALEMEAGLRSDITARLRALESKVEDWDNDIRELLGRYSAFLVDTARLKASEIMRRIPIEEPARRVIDRDPGERAAYTHAALRRIVASSAVIEENLRQVVRLIVERPGGAEELHFAYEIDGRVLLTVGTREFPHAARAVAQSLFEAARRAPLPKPRRSY